MSYREWGLTAKRLAAMKQKRLDSILAAGASLCALAVTAIIFTGLFFIGVN